MAGSVAVDVVVGGAYPFDPQFGNGRRRVTPVQDDVVNRAGGGEDVVGRHLERHREARGAEVSDPIPDGHSHAALDR